MNTSRFEERKKLAEEIKDFIKEYAISSEVKEGYNSPDAYAMLAVANKLLMEDVFDTAIVYPDSSYNQGGYRKSKLGEQIHDTILEKIALLRDSKLSCPHCEEKVPQYKFCTSCGKNLF